MTVVAFMTENWYQMTGDDVAAKLKTSKTEGLSGKAVRVSQRKYGKNDIYPVSKITFYNCLKSITLDYTSYLLIASALIAAVFEETVGAWPLVVLVALNIVALIIAYAKSQKILEGMDRYTLPVVRVIREGRLFLVDQKQLAVGDLIYLSRGDIVPADARLISAHDFCVDEERLFGKIAGSGIHFKTAEVALHETLPPAKQRNMVFAGTLVTSGNATAVITATGEATVICLTDKNHPIVSHESMPLLAHLQKISRVWSLIVIGAVFVMTLLDFLLPTVKHTLFASFIGAMSFAVSTMSEMYVAFGYIILACAVWQTVQLFRESDNAGAILKNPLCMDDLRHITTLLVPKEGIFTTRDSVADRIFAGDRLYDFSDRRGRRAMERPILYAILSTGMYGEGYLKKQSTDNGKLTQTEEESAILTLARRMDIYNVRLDRAYPLLDHKGIGGESEFETTLVSHKETYIAVSRGETEHILSRCSYYYKDGRMMLLTNDIRTQILVAYRKLVRQAYSIVAVATRAYTYNNLKFIGAAQTDMVFEGFVAFRVPYLQGIGQLVADAKEAGIKVILMSEGAASSESYFARQVGIVEKREQCVDSADLKKMKEAIRRTNASYYRLYCGLETQQKLDLIRYLRGEGEIVGIVGRRLEDLCLLREADVSFAQNIAVQAGPGKRDTVVSKVSESAAEEGCEALKFESDIIISDANTKGQGGFRAILDAIGIAKNTDMNVVRTMKYLLCTQTARFLLVLYTILFAKEGMSAVQSLFCGLFMDFVSVFVLAFRKPSPDILRTAKDAEPWLSHPIRMNLPSIITGTAGACCAITASFIAESAGFAQNSLSVGSVLFVTYCLISVLSLFSVQREDFVWLPGTRMNALHTLYLLTVSELFLLFFLFPTFGTVFGVAPFSPAALIVIVVLCLIELILGECIKMLAQMRGDPALTEEDAQTRTKHIEIAALFHMFRDKLHEETRAEIMTEAETTAKEPDPKTEKLKEMEDYVNEMKAKAKSSDEKPKKEAKPKKEKKAKKPLFAEKAIKKEKSEGKAKTKTDWFSEDDADAMDGTDLPDVRRIPMAGVHGGSRPSHSLFSDVDTDIVADMTPDGWAEDGPDPEAFAAAMAMSVGEPQTRDITIGGSNKAATEAGLRSFLRGADIDDEMQKETDREAEREFLGIGYLFSEAEYEAIMAAYNEEGVQEPIYNTETQTFDFMDESTDTHG